MGNSVDAGTPLHPPTRGRSVVKIGLASIGPTTPCWQKPGGPVLWVTREWLTACWKTLQTSVPIKTTDCWTSGTFAWRKLILAPPEGSNCNFMFQCNFKCLVATFVCITSVSNSIFFFCWINDWYHEANTFWLWAALNADCPWRAGYHFDTICNHVMIVQYCFKYPAKAWFILLVDIWYLLSSCSHVHIYCPDQVDLPSTVKTV